MTPDAITGLRDRLFGTIFIVAIAVPGIALFVVLPAALVLLVAAVPVTIAAAAVGLPYLLVRAIRRQTATWRSWPPIRSSPRSSSTST